MLMRAAKSDKPCGGKPVGKFSNLNYPGLLNSQLKPSPTTVQVASLAENHPFSQSSTPSS